MCDRVTRNVTPPANTNFALAKSRFAASTKLTA